MLDGFHDWLFAIRRTEAWSARRSWRENFGEAGRQLFFAIEDGYLDPDGQMIADGVPTGQFRFVEIDEVRGAFGDREWVRLEPPCPWVGEVEGFLSCEWWSDLGRQSFDAERFLAAGKGYVVRLRDGATFDAIARNTYRLGEANEKHGFGDGDDLPELGDAYDAYVWGEISDALEALGLHAERITYGTGHNRIRFDELRATDRRLTLAQTFRVFDAHRGDPLELWAYNNRRAELAALLEDR